MKLLRISLAVALLLGLGMFVPAQRAAAEAPKPVLTVAFSGYDQLIANVKTIGEVSGRPGLAGMLEGLVAMGTQGKGLAGLDKARPWGVLVFLGENDQPTVQGYIPADDLKALMGVVPNPATGQPFAPDADGVYELPGNGGKTMYAAQKGKWGVVSDSKDGLKTAVADPTAMISDLAKKYLVGIRASIQNVPAATREKYLGMAKMVLDMASQQQPNESEEMFALRSNNMKQAFAKLTELSKELEELVIGLGVEAASNSIFLDFELKALDGTKAAAKMAKLKDAKSNLAGFVAQGAAMTMLSSGTSDDDDVAEAKKMLDKLRTTADKELDGNEDLSKEKKTLAKQLLGEALDVLTKTIESKVSDGGAVVVLDDKLAIAFGMKIVDGVKLEGVVKKLVKEVAADDANVGKMVKLDADKHEGINFHVVTVPVPDPEAAAIFGETVQIVIGLGENNIFLAAGKKPVDLLKQVIDDSKKTPDKAILPMEMVFSGLPIAQFVAKVVPDANAKEQAEKVAASLAKSPGKDKISLTAKSIPNGVSVRWNVEGGLIKAISEAAPGGGGAAGAPAGGTP